MATANITAHPAHSNVTPIRPGVVVCPDKGEQARIGIRRRMYDSATAELAKYEYEGGNPEIAHMHSVMQKVGAKGLPSMHLRLIVRDDRPLSERRIEAARIVALREAEWKLAQAHARIAFTPDLTPEWTTLDAVERGAREALLDALRAYVAIPAERKGDIARKRRTVGKVWLRWHDDIREAIDADEARLDAERASKAEGRRHA